MQGYKRYGGRGISVCAEWANFSPFAEWAHAAGYRQELSIERIDTDGNYTPQNCTWADITTQNRNRSIVRKNADGVAWCGIAERNGIAPRIFNSRTKQGWSFEDASTIPKGIPRKDWHATPRS